MTLSQFTRTLAGAWRGVRAALPRLKRAERGSIAMKFALLIVPLIGMAGLAIDGSRAFLLKYKFQTALDTAALALGSTYATDAELDALAESFVLKNFQVGGARVTSVDVVSTTQDVFVRGTIDVDTILIDTFYSIFFGENHDKMTIAASTEVKRAGGGLMVALVLDNTGSMWGGGSPSNIQALITASDTLVGRLFGSETEHEDLRVTIVPYAAAVNPGLSDIVKERYTEPVLDPGDETKWAGCVMERSGANSMADTPASTELWEKFLYPPDDDNDYTPGNAASIVPGGVVNSNQVTGPNIGCPTPIQPLTKHRSLIDAAIDDMTAWNRGGTLTDIGIAWGLRALSPGAPFTQSQDQTDPENGFPLWDSPRWRRAMVIMTDGDSNFYNFPGGGGANQEGTSPNSSHPSASDYGGYGRRYDSGTVEPAGWSLSYAEKLTYCAEAGTSFEDCDPADRYDWNMDAEYRNKLQFDSAPELAGAGDNAFERKLSYRIQQLCEAAKAQDVVVYTVVFTSSVGSGVRDVYRNCASDPGKYWYAPNASSLAAAFDQVGEDLSKLRIVK